MRNALSILVYDLFAIETYVTMAKYLEDQESNVESSLLLCCFIFFGRTYLLPLHKTAESFNSFLRYFVFFFDLYTTVRFNKSFIRFILGLAKLADCNCKMEPPTLFLFC